MQCNGGHMIERINNILLDYENGTIQINGQGPSEAVNVTIKEPDGWNIRKLLNKELNYIFPER